MDSKKSTIEMSNDGALYIVKDPTAKPGNDTQVYNANPALDHKAMVSALITTAKQFGTVRDARQTLLGEIFKDPKLQGYFGKSDPKSGKVDTAFKAALRQAESAYFTMLETKGELRAVINPKSENPDKDFQAFCETITKDSNYANIKSWCTKYAAFVGAHPITKSGYLVPQPVMAIEIQKVLNIAPPDNSVTGRIKAINEHLKTLKEFKFEDVVTALVQVKELARTIQNVNDHYAELATHSVQGTAPDNSGGVVEASKHAIAAAAASKDKPRMQRAPRPTEAAPV